MLILKEEGIYRDDKLIIPSDGFDGMKVEPWFVVYVKFMRRNYDLIKNVLIHPDLSNRCLFDNKKPVHLKRLANRIGPFNILPLLVKSDEIEEITDICKSLASEHAYSDEFGVLLSRTTDKFKHDKFIMIKDNMGDCIVFHKRLLSTLGLDEEHIWVVKDSIVFLLIQAVTYLHIKQEGPGFSIVRGSWQDNTFFDEERFWEELI